MPHVQPSLRDFCNAEHASSPHQVELPISTPGQRAPEGPLKTTLMPQLNCYDNAQKSHKHSRLACFFKRIRVPTMFNEVLKRVLDMLVGFDSWVLAPALMVATIGWLLIGTKSKSERKRLFRQAMPGVLALAVAAVLIGIHHLIPLTSFPRNIAGILVLKIPGDDNGSLQRELVSSLNTELAQGEAGEIIEVWAANKLVDEKQGLVEAHKEARKIISINQ
jgi:hypothetical protein